MDDSHDALKCHTVVSGQHWSGLSSEVSDANLDDTLCRQACAIMPLSDSDTPTVEPTLPRCVLHIIQRRTPEEMRGIATRRIITMMASVLIIRERANKRYVAQTTDKDVTTRRSPDPENSITFYVCPTPKPAAAIRLRHNIQPETI